MGLRLGKDLGGGGGHIFPHPHGHTADHGVHRFKRHAGRGQLRLGLGQRHPGPDFGYVIHGRAEYNRWNGQVGIF